MMVIKEPTNDVERMEYSAWLYGKMADDLRAQAAKARYEQKHGKKGEVCYDG